MTPPETEELIRELRAERPEIDPDFAAELDAWAAAGFPDPRERSAGKPAPKRPAPRPPARRPLLALRRNLAPVLGVAASALLLVGLVAGIASLSPGGDDDAGDGGRDSVESVAREAAAPRVEQGAVGRASDGFSQASGDGRLRPGRERIEERSAALTLSTDPDEVQGVADQVRDVTERHDGIVDSSDIQVSAESARASFALLIPSENLQAAISDLSDLAHVSSSDESTLDITSPYVSAEERFGDARAAVDALLEELEEADSSAEIASLREQLAVARRQLAAARAQLRSIKRRADFSRVSLTVVGQGEGPGWSLGEAADDAVDVLEAVGGGTLIALAALAPIALIAALCTGAWRWVVRRRRERALD